jgi:L-threonine kinase
MDLTVRVPGSCGELVQGFAQGAPFLGTCPIDRYTTVEVSDSFSGLTGLGEKSLQALQLTLARSGKNDFPYGLKLTSELPQGKGMASSSADIAAVVVSVMEALGESWSPKFVMDIATEIEPTDGIFCPGIVLMNHVNGKVLAHFAQVPSLRVAVFDMGGTVDTCAFHQADKKSEDNQSLLQEFQQAMHSGRAEKIAQVATESAFANQRLLYKEELQQLWQLGQEAGALGINAAHSGTVTPPSGARYTSPSSST